MPATAKKAGDHEYPQIFCREHLLCVTVTQTPHPPKAWDQNQFGTSAPEIERTKWLRLPTRKKSSDHGPGPPASRPAVGRDAGRAHGSAWHP